MIEHVVLGLSLVTNIYLYVKRPFKQVKVYQHPQIPQVWANSVRKLKTRRNK